MYIGLSMVLNNTKVVPLILVEATHLQAGLQDLVRIFCGSDNIWYIHNMFIKILILHNLIFAFFIRYIALLSISGHILFFK